MTATLEPAAHVMPRASGLTLDVLDSLQAMEALAPRWERLLASYPGANLFLTPTWNCAWWRAFGAGKSLRLLALRDGDRLIGVAVYMLYTTRLRGLPVRVLGTFTNSHVSRTDIVVSPGFETSVAERIATYFAESAQDWDVAWLQQLPGEAPWLPPFVAVCAELGLRASGPVLGMGKCRLPLAGEWATYMAGKTGHFRARLKENRRRVGRHGQVRYRRSNGSAEDFAVFERLEARSWKHEDDGVRLGAAGWAFQHDVTKRGDSDVRCHNLFLEIDGSVVGALHALGYGDTAYSMQMLFDESVRALYPGRAQFSVHVADMFEDGGYRMLDFNSNTPFCKSWAETEQGFVSLQLHHQRPYSMMLWLLKRLRGRT